MDFNQNKTLQIDHIHKQVFVKMDTLEAALEACTLNNHLGYMDESDMVYPVTIGMADGAVDVRIYDLPPELESAKLKLALSEYGTIHTIVEEKWSKNVTVIEDIKTLVTYPNQMFPLQQNSLKNLNYSGLNLKI